MKISHTMFISKILTDLCAIRLKIRIKNTFSNIVYNLLVVKKSYAERSQKSLFENKW